MLAICSFEGIVAHPLKRTPAINITDRNLLFSGEAAEVGVLWGFYDDSSHGGDKKSEGQFAEVVLRLTFPQGRGEMLDTLGEDRDDGENGTTLDDNGEEIGLAMNPAEILRNEEMACRRNGEEFGDPLDKTQNHDRNPNW